MNLLIKKKFKTLLKLPFLLTHNFLYFIFLNNRKSTKNGINSILVIRTDKIGDFLLFAPSFDLLKQKYPKSKIVFIGNECVKELVPHYNSIDEFIPINIWKFKTNLFYFYKIIIFLKKLSFELVLYPAYSRTKEGDEIVSLVSSSEKIAFNGNFSNLSSDFVKKNNIFYTKLINSNHLSLPEIDRNKDFLNFLGIETKNYKTYFKFSEEELLNAKNIIHDLELIEGRFVIVFPGAGWPGRIWNFKNFSEIIKRLRNNNFEVVLAAGPKEYYIEQKINNFLDFPVKSLVGKTDNKFGTLGAIMSLSKLYFGSDTGPAHLARAVDCATLIILGGGNLNRFFPYGDPEKCQIIKKELPCYGCDWACIHSTIRCIEEIQVEDVWNKMKIILDIK